MSRKYKIAAFFCLLGVAIDQVTKSIVKNTLAPYGSYEVMENVFEFRYAENTGMAFGIDILAHLGLGEAFRTPLFVGITVLAVLIIGHLLRQSPDKAIRLPVGLGLILSGAFGNLIDRFRWGYVVDFVRVRVWPIDYHWPTFNMADTFISIGIALLIIDALFSREPEPAEEGAVAIESDTEPEREAEEGPVGS